MHTIHVTVMRPKAVYKNKTKRKVKVGQFKMLFQLFCVVYFSPVTAAIIVRNSAYGGRIVGSSGRF